MSCAERFEALDAAGDPWRGGGEEARDDRREAELEMWREGDLPLAEDTEAGNETD